MSHKKIDKPKKKGQNTSGQKPNKRKNRIVLTNSNSVNKSKTLKSTDNPIKSILNMWIPNTPVY